jgi:hypothetical protein
MACALTSGFSLAGCKDGIGGLSNVYFIEKGNVTSYTKASGVVTALVKATGKIFYKYELKRETANVEETIESNQQNDTVGYKQLLNIILNRNSVDIRNEILLLAKNQLWAVVERKDGTFWLYGEEAGMDLANGKRVSGTAIGDRSGYELAFEGAEQELAPQVAQAIADVLETAG